MLSRCYPSQTRSQISSPHPDTLTDDSVVECLFDCAETVMNSEKNEGSKKALICVGFALMFCYMMQWGDFLQIF